MTLKPLVPCSNMFQAPFLVGMPSTTALRFHLHPVAELVPVPTTNPVPGGQFCHRSGGFLQEKKMGKHGEESVSLSSNNGDNTDFGSKHGEFGDPTYKKSEDVLFHDPYG